MGAFYCAICRQTFFSGKGHIFGKSHQRKLKVVLVKFIEKVKQARRTIKNPQVEKFDCIQHECKFWCYCCDVEINKHATDASITVLYGGLLEHMATPEHGKKTHRFWWENKADPKLRDKFIVTEEEIKRFKTEVAKALESFAEKEDEFVKQQAAHIRAQEQHRQEVLQALLEPEPELEQSNIAQGPDDTTDVVTSSSHRILDEQAGPSWLDPVVDRKWAERGQGLTFIGYQDSSSSGNVHTGAIPPWLQKDPMDGSSGSAGQEIGPSLQDFLKKKELDQLRKLPPNRVGANFDHSSQTDANWLPSFGRVWNSGRRWQSRHQFREEEGQTIKRKRTTDHDRGNKEKNTA